jgi:cell division cycle 2-like
MTSVREINILLTMNHPNIVNVSEVVTSSKRDGRKDVYMVMEFVQQDLKSFLSKYQARLKIGEVCITVALRHRCAVYASSTCVGKLAHA